MIICFLDMTINIHFIFLAMMTASHSLMVATLLYSILLRLYKPSFRDNSINFAEKLKRSYMKQYIITIIFALCLASCSQHSKHWKTLTKAESLMVEKSDSALIIQREMDTTQLYSTEEMALYALLYTQTENKNYIDSKIRQ